MCIFNLWYGIRNTSCYRQSPNFDGKFFIVQKAAHKTHCTERSLAPIESFVFMFTSIKSSAWLALVFRHHSRDCAQLLWGIIKIWQNICVAFSTTEKYVLNATALWFIVILENGMYRAHLIIFADANQILAVNSRNLNLVRLFCWVFSWSSKWYMH